MDKDKIKAKALLDAAEEGGQEGQEAQSGENAPKPITDPMETLRKLCKGTLKLAKPLRGGGKDVNELHYDFCALTGAQMLNALDSVGGNSIFGLTNMQALALFAATAGECTELVDARDVREQLGSVDSVTAVQLAKLFYNASNRVGSKNISNG